MMSASIKPNRNFCSFVDYRLWITDAIKNKTIFFAMMWWRYSNRCISLNHIEYQLKFIEAMHYNPTSLSILAAFFQVHFQCIFRFLNYLHN